MDWLTELGSSAGWFGDWADWIRATGGFVAGMLLTRLLWWRRSGRLALREREADSRSATLDLRQEELLRQAEELREREATFRRLEESLKAHSEQLRPQIDQIRSWVDQIAKREETVALREAALERKATLGDGSLGG